ncbi:MAG: hypothetical protein E3J90_01470 [Promethearchaeota archaeon]|nr:MAG: hypothetical protein E3J90_01470 [Candidatus Lokiarchaeota archaeon]
MKAHSQVNRKSLQEDRIAICPKFGCEALTRVKPLKFGFLGFNKYPKCKKHGTPLVYIDERISVFIDAALSCLFDKAGLPPEDLLIIIKKQFPKELHSFIYSWVYCITIGRGAPIISRYMDSLSNAYLKKLTKKQVKTLKGEKFLKTHSLHQTIRDGMQEITNQYTRLLKHLRIHSEILTDVHQLKPLSQNLRNSLQAWQKLYSDEATKLPEIVEERRLSLFETKKWYDHILNMGTCRCLLGLSPEGKNTRKNRITAFDRYSAYLDFFKEGITKKFTKPDIEDLLTSVQTESFINVLTNEDENHGAIYIFTDNRTNKVYIGQTIRDIFVRFAEHLRDPCNQYLRKAIKYYLEKDIDLKIIKVSDDYARTGNDEFTIKLISYATNQDELNKLEIEEIKKRKSCVLDYFAIKNNEIVPLYGYNVTRGGTYRSLILSDKNAAAFSFIQEGELKHLVRRGLFISEIAMEFRVPDQIIYSKIQEFWANLGIYSIDDARNYFGGLKIYNSRVRHFILRTKSEIDTIEQKSLIRFEKLIKEGFSTSEIKMEMEIEHATLYAMLKVIGFNTFTGARDAFGVNDIYNERMGEKRIKKARKGKTHSQWIEVDESIFIKLIQQQLHYTDMASKLKIGERTLYKKSYEVFGISLSEANRIYRLYPEVEKILLNKKEIDESKLQDWVNAGLSVKEIDQEILKLLIGLGYDKKDIESLFGWDHFHVTRWIPEILNMDFYRARDEYWWKPRIIWLFSQDYSARQMRIVSKELIGRHVTHDIIVRIWAEESARYGSDLNKYLYNLYCS